MTTRRHVTTTDRDKTITKRQKTILKKRKTTTTRRMIAVCSLCIIVSLAPTEEGWGSFYMSVSTVS